MGHFVVKDKIHQAAKTVALRHKIDLGEFVESWMTKNPEIQEELKRKQVT